MVVRKTEMIRLLYELKCELENHFGEDKRINHLYHLREAMGYANKQAFPNEKHRPAFQEFSKLRETDIKLNHHIRLIFIEFLILDLETVNYYH